ncbi:MAG: histidine phosphatase family protein [Desulfobacterium sp.]
MTHIILVTHALTQWNIEKRIQGHTDVPLNQEGRAMAKALALHLRREIIHAVYTSDLCRALETAAPLARQKSLVIHQDIRLREGRSIFQERSDHYPMLPFPVEVETEPIVLERMMEVMGAIGKAHADETVLVVSHGAAVEIFISHLLSLNPESTMVYDNIRMAINRLDFGNGRWHCLELNHADAVHLDGDTPSMSNL